MFCEYYKQYPIIFIYLFYYYKTVLYYIFQLTAIIISLCLIKDLLFLTYGK